MAQLVREGVGSVGQCKAAAVDGRHGWRKGGREGGREGRGWGDAGWGARAREVRVKTERT